MRKAVNRRGFRASFEKLEERRLMAATIVDAAGNLTINNYYPKVTSLTGGNSFLTKASNDLASSIAANYLTTHSSDFGIKPADITSARITDQYTDPAVNGGMTHIYYQQTYNGLPIANTSLVVNVMPDGRVLSAAGGFVSGVDRKAAAAPSLPAISSDQALTIAGTQLALGKAKTAARLVARASGKNLITKLSQPSYSLDTITTSLYYVPTANGLELSWDMALRTAGTEHWYSVGVGTDSSTVLFANDWVDHATYNVIARPAVSPADGGFSVVTDPQDTIASPYGWHDTNGVAGAEFTDTRGNNVDAHLDRNDDDVADTSPVRPSGGSTLNFSGFTLNAAAAPSTTQNENVAQVNLFYLNNLNHDIHYRYGFTEAAGNFQSNNYGKGGTASDAVQADAQDSAGNGTSANYNNANFATPPDGQAGRMQMYVWNLTSPNRDGDLDSEIVDHEYGHGVSTRLTGGPSNSNSLDALQSGGMGEGWSDFDALMFEQLPTDTANGSYPVAAYSYGNAAGLRSHPYSFNMAINPLTIANYNTNPDHEVHDTGEIWTQTLYDMNWLLIGRYGFDANLQNGYNAANKKGNTLAMQLVENAYKIQPANPSFKDARDAILAADVALNGGADQDLIWQAFARRGMGVSFVDPSADSTVVIPAFDTPVNDPVVTASLPNSQLLTAYPGTDHVDFTFNQPMNLTSFSLADDVLSFSGGGSNLLTNINGFAWTSQTTLRVSFKPVTIAGSYTMVLGSNILAADDGHSMDQNKNGTSGESGDGYTATFTFAPYNSDNYGYKSTAYPYESINLVAGQPGVTTLITNSDDGSNPIALGSYNFNFYGTNYTASQIYASANGLITFGAANTEYVNTNFASSPTTPAIAPLWDDFYTLTAYAPTAVVLTKIDTADSAKPRLIIQWKDLGDYESASSTTFTAVLQLNTGTTPGRIVFNYNSLNAGASSSGAYGTVGIKSSGSTYHVVDSYNASSNLVGSGKAILTAIDVTPPTVSSTFNYITGPTVSLSFSEDVSASFDLSDLTVVNTTTNTTIANSALTLSADKKTLSFPGYPFGSLPDGNYKITFAAASINDAAGNKLDGNGDLFPGDNGLATFFVLAGDINHDRKIDIVDLGILSGNWHGTGRDYSEGDLNYDGQVDIVDLGMLAGNWHAELPAAAASAILDVVSSVPGKRVATSVLK